MSVLELQDIRRTFPGRTVPVLDGVSLTVQPGERVAIVGPSGSGKSTLLGIAGLLERPDAGTVSLGGVPAPDDARTRAVWRATRLGIVFQDHHLLPHASARDNVLVPLAGQRRVTATDRDRAAALLAAVGLSGLEDRRPAALSTGQRQRVAVARALVADPPLVLADEPTGALDRATADALMTELVAGPTRGVVVVTHDPQVAAQADRVLRLGDGRLEPA